MNTTEPPVIHRQTAPSGYVYILPEHNAHLIKGEPVSERVLAACFPCVLMGDAVNGISHNPVTGFCEVRNDGVVVFQGHTMWECHNEGYSFPRVTLPAPLVDAVTTSDESDELIGAGLSTFEEHPERCEACAGTGEWETECCSGAGGCSCGGRRVPMGRCNVCEGTGVVDPADPDLNPSANWQSIQGQMYSGSGPVESAPAYDDDDDDYHSHEPAVKKAAAACFGAMSRAGLSKDDQQIRLAALSITGEFYTSRKQFTEVTYEALTKEINAGTWECKPGGVSWLRVLFTEKPEARETVQVGRAA